MKRSIAIVLLWAILCCVNPLYAAHGDSFIGVNIHIQLDDGLDAVIDLNPNWVRVDFNWRDIERSQGNFNYDALDNMVDRLVAAGIDIFPSYGYTPNWARKAGCAEENGVCPPRAGLYEAALDHAVKHFRGRITHWGLWNEANLDGFWNGSRQEFIDLIVKPGGDKVHAICPECKVLGPELAHIRDDSDDWLKDILQQAGDRFDIITHHNYADFPETGWNIFSGDSFMNILHSCRFPIYCPRRPVRDILVETGQGHKDLWITETGERSDEATQLAYIKALVNEQEANTWYTNSFIYELVDCGCDGNFSWCIPDCDIDGYGMIRRISNVDSSWQNNFYFKPSFSWLKQQIADGRFGSDVTPDGDEDDDDPEPPLQGLVSLQTIDVLEVDGAHGEWAGADWTEMGCERYYQLSLPCTGAADLKARFASQWDADNLYFAIAVDDDVHHNTEGSSTLWIGDSIQLGLDMGLNGGLDGYDTTDDYEYTFAMANGVPDRERPTNPSTGPNAHPPEQAELAVQRSDSTTRYEIRIPRQNIPPLECRGGVMFGFSFLVNDNDGAGRKGWLEYTAGIGLSKQPGLFSTMLLDPSAICEGMVCDEVPDDYCDGETRVRYTTNSGYCDGFTGDCVYDSRSVVCAHGCLDGECLPPEIDGDDIPSDGDVQNPTDGDDPPPTDGDADDDLVMSDGDADETSAVVDGDGGSSPVNCLPGVLRYCEGDDLWQKDTSLYIDEGCVENHTAIGTCAHGCLDGACKEDPGAALTPEADNGGCRSIGGAGAMAILFLLGLLLPMSRWRWSRVRTAVDRRTRS